MARLRPHWFAQFSAGCFAIAAALGLSGRATTYGAALLPRDSVVARWRPRIDDPIRVWVEPNAVDAYDARVHDAFVEWTSIGLPLRFVFVDRARDAEIRVRWTDRLDRKTGNTVWSVDRNGWMRGSDVLLAMHLGDGREIDARSVHAIALHEIGHALGLSHSDDGHDVMAPLIRVAALSTQDRAAALSLYGHLR